MNIWVFISGGEVVLWVIMYMVFKSQTSESERILQGTIIFTALCWCMAEIQRSLSHCGGLI